MSALRMLVVEDDPVSNFETCTALRDRGVTVLGVDCGAAALHVFATGIPLAALATDIDLGKGIDGFSQTPETWLPDGVACRSRNGG